MVGSVSVLRRVYPEPLAELDLGLEIRLVHWADISSFVPGRENVTCSDILW